MSDRHAHLEMIQGVVNRLSQNSFLLKGWAVVLVSAMFALATKEAKATFVFLAYLPCIAFWCLDAYYLWQERLFRALYDHVRQLPEDEVTFSMDANLGDTAGITWLAAVTSRILVTYYGAVLVSILAAMYLSR